MSVSTSEPTLPASSRWLVSARFDLAMIAGVLALALLMGGIAQIDPAYFAAVVAVDFWLLAYPHVASTYTRIAFDRHSAKESWFLLSLLPVIVIVATGSFVWLWGAVALNSAYFVWQTFHYTRQSYGIARSLRRCASLDASDPLGDFVVFAIPIWGVVHRAAQAPSTFFGAPIWCPIVPHWFSLTVGSIALISLVVYTLRELRRSLRDQSLHEDVLFVFSHVLITLVSYMAIPEITRGWLFINIWHNAQYILFVWAQNRRRFRAGVDPDRRLISWLSQRENALAYGAVCLVVSTLFFALLRQSALLPSPAWLPLLLVAHQAVNFHHYLVDGVIWKSRTRAAATSTSTVSARTPARTLSERALPLKTDVVPAAEG